MHTGALIDLPVDQIDADGAGVGRCAGHTVHARGLAPGERGEVRIDHVSPHRREAWGTLRNRTGPASPDRVEPGCPAYGRCGGCAWQHLAYPAQLEHKRTRVAAALATAGFDGPVDMAPSPRVEAYRNVGKYVVGRDAAGRLELGAYAPRTHDIVPTLGCRLVEPAVDRAARAARDALEAAGLTPFDERSRTGHARYVVARANRDGEVLVALVTAPDAPRNAVEAAASQLRGGPAAGVVWIRNDSTSGSLLAGEAVPLAGQARLTDWLGDVPVELAITAFFQVNRAQALAMYGFVADSLVDGHAPVGPGATADRPVADLYCGVGGIALTLARRGAHVVGIERVADAIAAARSAATRAGLLERARFEVGDASQLPQVAPGALAALVVNPPRKGLDEATRGAVRAAAATDMVYVSCNPDTLARDARELAADYELVSARAFDLMPATAQVETVAQFRLRSR